MLTETQIPMLSVRAAPVPSSYNAESNTIDVIWSTGAQVRRFDWLEGPYTEELVISPESCRLERLNSGAPVLNTHERDELEYVIGVVERAWIEGGNGIATLRFSSREDVQPYIKDIADGIIRNVSVGYAVHRYEIDQPTDGSMPIWRAVDWEPYEISMVPVPADMGSHVRSDRQAMRTVFLTQRGIAMSEPEVTAPVEEAQAPEAQAPVETQAETIDAEDVATRAVQAERERVFAIRDAVRLAKLDDGIADEMIRSGKSLDQCRDDIWRRWADRVDATATQPNHSEPAYDKRSAEIAQSLLKQVSGVK